MWRFDKKEAKGVFGGDGIALYLDYGEGYMTVNI